MNNDNFPILLVEDSSHDITAVERSWKRFNILNPLHVVHNGEECLNWLYQRGDYASPKDAPRPGLILLDLNMPKMGGIEVLEHIRNAEEDWLNRLTVVVLTTSRTDEDQVNSHNLGVNAYIMKPVGFDNFAEAIRTIQVFWQLVELPDR